MKQKGFANIIVIIGFVILASAAGYFIVNQQIFSPAPIYSPTPTSTETQESTEGAPTTSASPSGTPFKLVTPQQQQIPPVIPPQQEALITVRSPNGGETLGLGGNTLISWSVPSPSKGFKSAIFVMDAQDPSRSWYIWSSVAERSEEQGVSWLVGQKYEGADFLKQGSYLIKICQELEGPKYEHCDLSDAPFNIVQ